jgi:hypothetical protein
MPSVDRQALLSIVSGDHELLSSRVFYSCGDFTDGSKANMRKRSGITAI